MTTRAWIASMLTSVALLCNATAVRAQTVYRLVDLGQLDGVGSFPMGINESGVTSGWLITSTHEQRAARALADHFELVPGLENSTSEADAINAQGDLAGRNNFHAIRYTVGGGIEDLGASGFPTSINRWGDIVGQLGSGRAFIAHQGSSSMLDLGTFGGSSSYAGGINDAREVSGWAAAADGSIRAFVYTPGIGMRDLGWPNYSRAEGINNQGQVTGTLLTAASREHAFRYVPGLGFTDLDPVATRNSHGWAINDRGDVVGTFVTNSSNHAFVYTDSDGFLDLNDRIVSGGTGWILVAAVGINSAGEIVGQAQYANQGPPRGFKLVPVTDVTPPDIACGVADGAWHSQDVSILCTASDTQSGLANAADGSFSLTTSVAAGTETTNGATGTRSICDQDRNCATAGPISGNRIDRKPPMVTIAAPTATTYMLGQSVSASYSCTDGGSGVASCTGSVATGAAVNTSNVGPLTTFTVNATDAVGNAASQSVGYAVAYNVCLLYDPTKAHNSGSTVPIKIQLCDASGVNRSSATTVVTATGLSLISPNASGILDDSGSSSPDVNFRYDSTLNGGGYIFNLNLQGFGTGTYSLLFQAANDSTVHAVQFQVK